MNTKDISKAFISLEILCGGRPKCLEEFDKAVMNSTSIKDSQWLTKEELLNKFSDQLSDNELDILNNE